MASDKIERIIGTILYSDKTVVRPGVIKKDVKDIGSSISNADCNEYMETEEEKVIATSKDQISSDDILESMIDNIKKSRTDIGEGERELLAYYNMDSANKEQIEQLSELAAAGEEKRM